MSGITPCLWFDGKAEEAADFYASLFPDSRVDAVHRAPSDYPSGKAGDVLTVEFTLMGRPFTGLNGGPLFRFNEAISFQIPVETQAEADHLADALSAVPRSGTMRLGEETALAFRGRSFRASLSGLSAMLIPPGQDGAFGAMMQMKRIDIAALERAANGVAPSA